MRRANILATAMALLLAVPGTAAAISTDPTSLAFGNVPLNTKVTKDVAVTVDAGYRVNAAYMPFAPGFSVDLWTCPSLVAPGTCTVKVSYTPTTLGDVTDTMTLIEQAVGGTDRQFIPIGLTASGVSAYRTDPTSLAFGNVPLNTKVTKDVAVTVDAGYRVNAAYMPFAPGFSVDLWTCPSLVAPGTCTVKVSYTPTTLGDVTDTMTLIEQAVGGTDRQFIPIGLTASGVEGLPPTTTASAISGASGYSFGTWARADVVVTLSATDNDGGSGVDRTEYTLDGGASTTVYAVPFAVSSEGESSLQFQSTDNVGNVETVQTATVKIDKTAPTVAITDPTPDGAVQDNFGFTADLSDSMSGPDSLSFSVRSDDGSADGKPIGFEKLAATKVGASGSAATFRLGFDTTKLSDGYYLLLAQGSDAAGNVTSSSATFHVKVVNLALVKMLPATNSNKAGRTMPVKFSLRENSTSKFIENQQLTIKIHQKGSSSILQSSTYGTGATNYRIDSAAGLYIANFQTGKTPTTYVVEVWRQTATAPLLIGTFDFRTVK